VNTQEYILSGITESYVLGLSSDEERAEFEKMCAAHPEVLAARNAFELKLEKQAMDNAAMPPEDLKRKIMAAIENTTSSPVVTAKIVSMSDDRPVVLKANWLKYVAAACFVLLAGSLVWNIIMYSKNKQLVDNDSRLRESLNVSNDQLAELEKDVAILQQNRNIKMTALQGTTHSPQSFVTVYWDTTSKDVYLMINNLPQPPSDKQYQLWALLGGQPIDMGMIEMDDVSVKKKKLLLQMKNAQNAEAFAITLEKKGGSVSPTMEEMYVMGKL